MLESPLSRYAGPIAVVAGGLFAVSHVGQFCTLRPQRPGRDDDRSGSSWCSAPRTSSTFPLLLIALVALYARQAGRGGAIRSGRLLHRAHRHGGSGRRHVVRRVRRAVAVQVAPAAGQRRPERKRADERLVGQRGALLARLDLVRPGFFPVPSLPAGLVHRRRDRRSARVQGRDRAMGSSPSELAVAAVGVWLIRHRPDRPRRAGPVGCRAGRCR